MNKYSLEVCECECCAGVFTVWHYGGGWISFWNFHKSIRKSVWPLLLQRLCVKYDGTPATNCVPSFRQSNVNIGLPFSKASLTHFIWSDSHVRACVHFGWCWFTSNFFLSLFVCLSVYTVHTSTVLIIVPPHVVSVSQWKCINMYLYFGRHRQKNARYSGSEEWVEKMRWVTSAEKWNGGMADDSICWCSQSSSPVASSKVTPLN